MNMKLEVVDSSLFPTSIAPKHSYEKVGFRLDIDIANENFRGIQFTPPRSEASIIFGKAVIRPSLARKNHTRAKKVAKSAA